MLVIPAIDLRGGRCVRLVQGRADEETVFGKDPTAVARRWLEAGAELIHVVDLDGAFTGLPQNLQAIQGMVGLGARLQVGGGVRDLATVTQLLEVGVERVILGTVAVTQPELVRAACDRYGERILVGIDAREGRVAVRGWVDGTEVQAVALAGQMQGLGVGEIIYTDIARDGMLGGPDLAGLERMAATGVRVIASGGVATMDDVRQVAALAPRGVVGMIIGKALYTGGVHLKAALSVAAGETAASAE